MPAFISASTKSLSFVNAFCFNGDTSKACIPCCFIYGISSLFFGCTFTPIRILPTISLSSLTKPQRLYFLDSSLFIVLAKPIPPRFTPYINTRLPALVAKKWSYKYFTNTLKAPIMAVPTTKIPNNSRNLIGANISSPRKKTRTQAISTVLMNIATPMRYKSTNEE